MALKSKLILLLTMSAIALCIIIAGVYAAAQQKISMQGTVNFEIADQCLYLRDVRIQHDMSQSPTSVQGFRKGYINGDFDLDLSESDLGTNSCGTFVMYFDVVNLIIDGQTSEYLAEASWTGSQVAGVTFSIDHDSRMIDEGTATPATMTDSTPLSGTVILEVNLTSGTSFDLSNITITIRQPQQIADLSFTTDDATMTASVADCASTATSVIIPQTISKRTSGSATTYWEGNDYTVTSIGNSAFYSCRNLTTINIPDSVTSIGDYAFSNCSGLTTINIPDGVTSIGDQAFNYCTKLTTINIPDGVTSIGDGAFSNCSGLTTINIPDGVTSIGDQAFNYCTKLTTINIPDSVTSIGYNAFVYCTSLTTINIPDSVTSIGYNAFSNCSGLTTVTIGSGVTSIGEYAFRGCSKLTTITIKATTPPSLGNSSAIPSNVTNIKVPAESVGAYRTADNWSTYANKISAIA